MTMALMAQTVVHQLRSRLGAPLSGWDARHLAHACFQGRDGDMRVSDETIIVTSYDAPTVERLREHEENLPEKFLAQNVHPRSPWLYDCKLDCRCRSFPVLPTSPSPFALSFRSVVHVQSMEET